MSRGKGSALATTTLENAPPAGSTITRSQAIALVRQLGEREHRAAKERVKAKRQELERAIGGHTTRVDETVIDQAKALMTRLALIGNRQERSYQSGNDAIKKVVGKMGAIVGELQAIMLTSNVVGLFEQVNEGEYIGWGAQRNRGDGVAPLDAAGSKTRGAAREMLSQYTVVEDPPKTRGKKGAAAEPAADAQPIDLEDPDDLEPVDDDQEFDDD